MSLKAHIVYCVNSSTLWCHYEVCGVCRVQNGIQFNGNMHFHTRMCAVICVYNSKLEAKVKYHYIIIIITLHFYLTEKSKNLGVRKTGDMKIHIKYVSHVLLDDMLLSGNNLIFTHEFVFDLGNMGCLQNYLSSLSLCWWVWEALRVF